MVSKTVLFALVALCCTAALAAPSEDKHAVQRVQDARSMTSCFKAIKNSLGLLSDAHKFYSEYMAIFAEAKAAKAACEAQADATAEAIALCKSAASKDEMSKLVAETTKLAARATEGYTVVIELAKCF